MDRSMIISIVYMVALFAIFYFLFIRPQRKKEKQLDQLRSSLEAGEFAGKSRGSWQFPGDRHGWLDG